MLGKSFLSAVYCVTRCILYPGTKICIASGTRGQALNVLEKIMYELKPLSAELRLETDEKQSKVNGTEAKIVFKNSSVIKVVTASDSARGNMIEQNKRVSKMVRRGFGSFARKVSSYGYKRALLTIILKSCPHSK